MNPLDLEEGVKVKFDICKIFAGHNFLQGVFAFSSPSTNNKRDIRLFNVMTPLDLEAGDKGQIQDLQKIRRP